MANGTRNIFIEYAQKNDKRIVGVWELGNSGCEIPDSLKDRQTQ